MASTTTLNFDSFPNEKGRYTRIRIDKKGCTLLSIQSLMEEGKEGPSFATNLLRRSMFQIDFQPIDLASAAHAGLPAINGAVRSFQATDEQVGTTDGEVLITDGRSLTLKFFNIPETPADKTIEVHVTFRAYDKPGERGWIRMELYHTYPDGTETDTQKAWESSVIFPRVCYKKENVDEFSLLNPAGFTRDLHTAAHGDLHDESFLPIQFLSWYKRYAWKGGTELGTRKRLDAVIIHGTDEWGYHKTAGYFPKGLYAKQANDTGITDTDVFFRLKAPLFLKNTEQSLSHYTRAQNFLLAPTSSEAEIPDVSTTELRKHGYGGAVMDYRIKAVVLVAADANDPLDWHQLADEYKAWLDSAKPSFWKKAIQNGENAPLNQMAPVTVIANYSLLGAVGNPPSDPVDADHQKTYDSQVIYPVKAVDSETDLGSRLGQIKSWFNYDASQQPLSLEAQIWGWERGSFYCLVGDLQPAWDAVHPDEDFPFKGMVEDMYANGIWTSITTDPTLPRFGGVRYLGHFRPGQEGEEVGNDERFWWKYPFPSEFQNDDVLLQRLYDTDRMYLTSFKKADGQPSKALQLQAQLFNLTDLNSPTPTTISLALTFYGFIRCRFCPSSGLHEMYGNNWLKNGLVKYIGNQLLEFMLHNYGQPACYRTDHQHLPSSANGIAAFDGVIGYGPWFIEQMQALMDEATRQYPTQDSFALTNEFTPTEFMISKFHEHYDHFDIPPFHWETTVNYCSRPLQEQLGNKELFNQFFAVPFATYVYSGKLPSRMSMGRVAPHSHPGYKIEFKETREQRGGWIFNGGLVSTLISLTQPITFQNFTLETWVVPYAGHGTMNVFTLGTNTDKNLIINLAPTKMEFKVILKLKGKTLTGNIKIPANSWSHIACVGKLSEGQMQYTLYINGIQRFQTTQAVESVLVAAKMNLAGNIGARKGSYYGWVDEARFWGNARSQREICATMYRLLNDDDTPFPIVHLDMDITPQEATDFGLCTFIGDVSYAPTHSDTSNHTPTYMLSEQRDIPGNIPNFWTWRLVCEAFASHYYKVVDTGVSPQGLVTAAGTVYSYNRVAQDLFNLRFNIFRICRSAVLGRRIFTPAYFFEEPANVFRPLLKVARAAVQMQYSLRDVFLKGRMLGETWIANGNQRIETWYAPLRSFHDIPGLDKDIKDKLRRNVANLPDPLDLGYIRDAMSVLMDTPDPLSQNGNAFTIIRPNRVFQDQVSHFVWLGPPTADGSEPAIYYVFSNAGNTKTNHLEFNTHRGMIVNKKYRFASTHFDSSKTNAKVDEETGIVTCPATVEIEIAPRSFKVVRFVRM